MLLTLCIEQLRWLIFIFGGLCTVETPALFAPAVWGVSPDLALQALEEHLATRVNLELSDIAQGVRIHVLKE